LRLATRRTFVITALSLSLLRLLLISASFRVELSVGEIANDRRKRLQFDTACRLFVTLGSTDFL
jgi:hypothetical protein